MSHMIFEDFLRHDLDLAHKMFPRVKDYWHNSGLTGQLANALTLVPIAGAARQGIVPLYFFCVVTAHSIQFRPLCGLRFC